MKRELILVAASVVIMGVSCGDADFWEECRYACVFSGGCSSTALHGDGVTCRSGQELSRSEAHALALATRSDLCREICVEAQGAAAIIDERDCLCRTGLRFSGAQVWSIIGADFVASEQATGKQIGNK